MRTIGRVSVCLLVAFGAAAFLPPCAATADAFETPKTVFWCLALLPCAFAGATPPMIRGRRDAGGLAAIALLGWMLARSLAARPFLDPIVLVGWMLPPVLYLAGRSLSAGAVRAVARTAFWVGCAQASLMLVQRVGADPLFGTATAGMAYAPGRMIGTVGYHNQAVDLLAVCAALGMASGVGSAAILAGLALIAVPTAYRAGLAGIAVGAAFLLPWSRPSKCSAAPVSRRRWRWRAPALAVAAVALLAAARDARARLREAVLRPLDAPALRTRATMARAAWAMIRERPATGWGSGAYAFQYMRRVADGMPERLGHEELGRVVYAREPHNDALHLWCEFGLAGLFLAGAWLIAVAARQSPAGRFLLGYWFVASCFGFPWHDAAAGPLAGLALGMMERRPEGAARRLAPMLRIPMLAVGAAGVFLAVAQLGTDAGWWRARNWQGRSLAREGGLLAMDGRLDEAEKALVSSRRIERSPEQCNNLGFVRMKRGDPSGAEALYREWAESGIDHARALRSLAGAQEAQRKWLEAGRTLLRLHFLWPRESSDADLFRTGSLLLLGGDAEAALRLVRRFAARNGRTDRWTGEWENLFGAAERGCGHAGRARIHFLRALEKNPRLLSARRNLEALDRR